MIQGTYEDTNSLRCRLCGNFATRYQDHGPDGVALYCEGHDASEVEPLACAPLRSAPALYLVDGETVTTLIGFIIANTDPVSAECALDDETIAAIENLAVEQVHEEDLGAGGVWKIERLS